MNEEQQDNQSVEKQSSALTKSIIGLAAICALVIGVWFGVKGIGQHETRQAEQAAKEAVHASQASEAKAIKAGSDVAFLLDIQLENLQGEPKTVASQLAKVTLVNFWATWCAPCREEMPVFNAVHQKYQDKGFGVLGLTIDNPLGTANFVDQLGIKYPILMAENEGWDLLSQTGNPKNLMPYSFLIDQNGKILETKLGPLHEKELVSWVDKYL